MNQTIHIFSSKGGCGKTTTAVNFSGALAARGFSVVLVDQDPHGSHGGATRWLQQAQASGRRSPFPVVRTLSAKAADAYDFAVYDHPPGGRSATQLPQGLVVVPTPLDPGSFHSALKVIDGLRHRPQAPLLLPTRVRLERSEQRRLAAALGVPVIRDRACFGSLFGQGATLNTEGTGLIGMTAAREEFDFVVERILAQCRPKHKRRKAA